MKFSSIVLSTLAFADAPMIDIVHASASPIISADAVAVVRRGLRRAFWPARLPTARKTPAYAHRASASSGRQTSGAAAVTPSRTARIPPPTQ